MTTHLTTFGQTIDVGDVVGWGHRDGNMSTQQIGIVLKLAEKQTYGRTTLNATCHWVLGNGGKRNYTSTTTADSLFVLDPSTLGQAQYEAILAAAEVIAAKDAVKAEAQ